MVAPVQFTRTGGRSTARVPSTHHGTVHVPPGSRLSFFLNSHYSVLLNSWRAGFSPSPQRSRFQALKAPSQRAQLFGTSVTRDQGQRQMVHPPRIRPLKPIAGSSTGSWSSGTPAGIESPSTSTNEALRETRSSIDSRQRWHWSSKLASYSNRTVVYPAVCWPNLNPTRTLPCSECSSSRNRVNRPSSISPTIRAWRRPSDSRAFKLYQAYNERDISDQ